MNTQYYKDKTPEIGKLYISKKDHCCIWDEEYKFSIATLSPKEIFLHLDDSHVMAERQVFKILTAKGIVGWIFYLDESYYEEVT